MKAVFVQVLNQQFADLAFPVGNTLYRQLPEQVVLKRFRSA